MTPNAADGFSLSAETCNLLSGETRLNDAAKNRRGCRMSIKIEPLGRLGKVALRDVWEHEQQDFTPWLAREANIKLLGETLGIDLEVEAQEKNVGPFRADILCKDTTEKDRWVLIENQLEKTDHCHLGQLLTYASGLQAVTIVWIADRFTEEHRATLDWLNEITDDRVNFFGLEIELWKIGDSQIAPKFNVVSKPNDWTKTVLQSANRLQVGELSETKRLYLEFWSDFGELTEKRRSSIRKPKPSTENWMAFPVGRSYFRLIAAVSKQEKWLEVHLCLDGPDHKSNFKLLQLRRTEIENAIGPDLDWRELPKEGRIMLERKGVDVTNRLTWTDLQNWLIDKLEVFSKVFGPIVKSLDAADYQAPQLAP
jgi:hypothetical protein